MKGQVTIFENAQFGQVRTAGTSEQPLFCLADVRRVLGLEQQTHLKERLSPKGCVLNTTPTKGGNQKLLFINEPNLYRCIFQSRKKEAEAFQDWVFEEVLPSIRAKGSYALTKQLEQAEADYDRIYGCWKNVCEERKNLMDENKRLEYEKNEAKDSQDTLRSQALIKDCHIRALTKEVSALKKELDKKISLELQGWAPQEKVYDDPTYVFGKAVLASGKSCSIAQLAKVLRSNGVETGERRLMTWLRANGYLCMTGTDRNFPTQRAMDKGFFEVKTIEVVGSGGVKQYKVTPLVTPQGQSHVLNKFLSSSF